MERAPAAWRIQADKPERLTPITPDYESEVESWIDQDPSTVDTDLLVIGRQVSTDFATSIDLLGIDSAGNLVIVELKRDKTARETVAQALEYAAWAARLGYEEIINLAQRRFGDEASFRKAFFERFEVELPDALNQSQRIILVAPTISDRTHAVIEYLNENYSMPINAVAFSVFDINGQHILVRQLALPEAKAAGAQAASAKTRAFPTIEQLLEQARLNRTEQICEELMTLKDYLKGPWRGMRCWLFGGRRDDPKNLTAMTIYPTAATKEGAVVIHMDPNRLVELFPKPQADWQRFIERMQQQVGVLEPPEGAWSRFSLSTVAQAQAFVREFLRFAGIEFDAPT